MALGWKPKSMVIKPNIPLRSSVLWMDNVKQAALKTGVLIYQGFRPENTYQLH